MATQEEALLRLLTEANPWWTSGELSERLAPPYRLREFSLLQDEMAQRPILALGGPRQVGKTTLMYQLIQEALRSGTEPRRILFVSFDFPGMAALTDDPLNEALRLYGERVLKRSWLELPGRVMVFLDEITRVPNWHRDLKGWFDLGYDLKFVVSDSSLTALRQGAAESLAGRLSTHLILPWKFVDALLFQEPRLREDWLASSPSPLRLALRRSMKTGRAGTLFKALRELSVPMARQRARLKAALDRYLLMDGFPELLDKEDLQWCAHRLQEYLSLTLVRDLYRLFDIRASGVLEDLLALVARESGQRISYRGWADLLRIQERTLKDYLDYLEETYLVSEAEFFAASRAKRIRKQRKIYLQNPGLRNVLLGRLDEEALRDPAALGPAVESVVHDHAKRLVHGLAPGLLPPAFYWRDRQGHEVDVVVEIDGRPLPIEVKHRGDPTRGLEGLRAFLAAHPAAFGLVVTRDRLALEDNLVFLPLELFLLMS